MKVIQKVRGTGKTHDLVQEVIANPKSVLIVPTINQKYEVQIKYPDIKGRVKTFQEMEQNKIGRLPFDIEFVDCYIDNLDMIISQRCKPKLKAITLEKEELDDVGHPGPPKVSSERRDLINKYLAEGNMKEEPIIFEDAHIGYALLRKVASPNFYETISYRWLE